MLKNKVAIVTGGTRGIGFGIVKKFLENNAKVCLFGSKQETVEKAIEQLKNINSEWDVIGAWPNLLDHDEVANAMLDVYKKWGKIDILVNNAGISQREKISDLTYDNFNNIMDLNVKAVFNCTKNVVAYMKEQHSGSIINTSSMVSIYGQPSGVGYPTSKFAVNGMTKSLARELGPDNIRVNAVAPGVTNTDMVKNLPEELIKPLIATIPLQRVGEVEDVANCFLFLASDMAAYVTGEILSVDGAARS